MKIRVKNLLNKKKYYKKNHCNVFSFLKNFETGDDRIHPQLLAQVNNLK